MGFMDKIKGIFKKKDKSDKPAKSAEPAKTAKAGAAPAAKAARAAEFKGEGKVADALRNGADKIDARVAAGLITEKRADMIMAGLKAVEASDAPEDAKLIDIAQTIGALYL